MSSAETQKTVYVIYYSMYGHVEALAREICKGLEKAGGEMGFTVSIRFILI